MFKRHCNNCEFGDAWCNVSVECLEHSHACWKLKGKNMEEKISKGVMKMYEYKDEIIYKAMCSCGSNDHDLTMAVKYDKKFHSIDLEFWKIVAWNSYWKDKWYEKWWMRIKGSLKMLFTGYIEVEEVFLIQDTEVIDNIITAFIEGRKKLAISHEKAKADLRKIKEK